MTTPIIILVHGVGVGEYDTWQTAYTGLLQLGFKVADIEEFEWSHAETSPVGLEGTTFQGHSRLVRSLFVCANIGFCESSELLSDPFKTLDRVFSWAIRLLLFATPLLCFSEFYILLSRLALVQDQLAPSALLEQLSIVAGYATRFVLLPQFAIAHEADFHALLRDWVVLLTLVGAGSFVCRWLEPSKTRRSLAEYTRRFFLLLCSPLLAIACLPFRLDWLGIISLSIQWMLLSLPFVLLAAVFNSSNFSAADSPLVFLEVAAGAGALSLILDRIVSPLLGVIADISFYVGDGDYRHRLQDRFSLFISSLDLKNRDVWFVGHSLGSVICVDYLLEKSTELSGCRSVNLITMGSPLRRFFNRFFPSFCPDPDCLSQLLGTQLPAFKWTNIFRPFDPIGTRLATTSDTYINDVNTHQRGKVLLRAHTGYWSDPVVMKAARTPASPERTMRSKLRKDVKGFTAPISQAPNPSIVRWYSQCVTLILPLCILVNATTIQQKEVLANRELLQKCSSSSPGIIEEGGSWFNQSVIYLRFKAVYAQGERSIVEVIPSLPQRHLTLEQARARGFMTVDEAKEADRRFTPLKVCYDTGPPFRFNIPEIDRSAGGDVMPSLLKGCIISLIFFFVSRKPIIALVLMFFGCTY
jgi:hypothetical protein